MMARPDRSDARLPAEEEERIAEGAREYFEGMAPRRRHSKPSRSDYSATYTDALIPSDHNSIPELDKLQDLEGHHPETLVYSGDEVVEEYVETEYYKDLNGIDKQHHTTGTGFITMKKSNNSGLDLAPVSDASGCPVSCKGNPATNEWIPSADTVFPVSQKPNRSEA